MTFAIGFVVGMVATVLWNVSKPKVDRSADAAELARQNEIARRIIRAQRIQREWEG